MFITTVAFLSLSFINGVAGKSQAELEKQVLDQFVEVYDRIIRIEKEHVKTIQELEKKHEDNSNEIQFLKQKVEDLQKMNAPETCGQLVKQNISRGQDVFVDSDGVNHGKKQLLALILFLFPCPFWIRFCQLDFYRNFPNFYFLPLTF